MKWNHIMGKQPLDGEEIIQIDPPYKGHYPIGQRTYTQKCSFEEVLKFYKMNDLGHPDFWWISKKDFPFPVFEEKI